ncbi:MAG: transferase [Proteobacteria bacterium]|nr:transferase [Pseudomonadota bacterium]
MEVAWLIERINKAGILQWDLLGYVAKSEDVATDSDLPILGDDNWLLEQPDLFIAIGIGNPQVRRTVIDCLRETLPLERFPALVDPTAIVEDHHVVRGSGSVVSAGCIATTGVVIEEFAFLNLSCTLGHGVRVGRYSVINPTVNISGGVTIGRATQVGTGAQILQYLNIGEECSIGAGSVVTKNVVSGQTVVGIPARPI